MNTLAEKFNIPTYPIADGMTLGRRTLEEYNWLLDRGMFVHWHNKYLIMKHDEQYHLLRNTAPEPVPEAEAPTLDALVKDHHLPITQFQWHPHWEDESA